MPINYDAVDIKWSWNGDCLVGKDGDFDDTFNDQVESLIQEIQSVVQAELGDWAEHPTYAATLSDFIGEPNTRETGNRIQQRVVTSLLTAAVVVKQDLTVRIMPVDIHTVLIIIKVLAAPTGNNSVRPRDGVVVTMVYDYIERAVLPIDTFSNRTFFE
jgi:hypothetical protein